MSNLPTTIQDSIKERIKSIVGELIPEETYNTIVAATVNEFMKVDLPKLVKDELAAEYKKLISAEFQKPEWRENWNNGGFAASDAIKNIIVEAAPQILAGMMGFAAQQVVMQFQNNMNQYKGY